MATDLQALADDSDQMLDRVPLGRNRLLRAMGVTLFGAALTLFVPKRVAATHIYPSPCFGAGRCHSCTPYCGCSGCTPAYNVGCPNGNPNYNCWWTCEAGWRRLRKCCDYYSGGELCICDCDAGPC